MKDELAAFFAALRFFTRIPVPAWVGHSQAQLDHSARYFPLVGALVGLIGGGVTLAAALVLPLSLAVALGMAATVLATGAFHEDGLADACDGFGGGWDTPQVLTIMKDSRIGSYGAIALVLMLLSKHQALVELAEAAGVAALLAVLVALHALSRLAPVLMMAGLPYVREDALAKAKPLAQSIRGSGLLVAIVLALAPLALLPLAVAWAPVLAVAGVAWMWGAYCRRRIGGYTGDCLGAGQQLAELAGYLALLCVWR